MVEEMIESCKPLHQRGDGAIERRPIIEKPPGYPEGVELAPEIEDLSTLRPAVDAEIEAVSMVVRRVQKGD